MILDRLSNWRSYQGLSARFASAFEFLETAPLASLAAGRHAMCGEDLFALVQDGLSKPQSQAAWEAHRTYADIQYVIAGRERMGHTFAADLPVRDPYDPVRDLVFFNLPEGRSPLWLTVPAGHFVIFLPQDVHAPGLAVEAPEPVRKVVVKVRL